jgi:hypothetical protein
VTEEKRLMMETIQGEIINKMKAFVMDLTRRAAETDKEACTDLQKMIKEDIDDILFCCLSVCGLMIFRIVCS